MSRENIRLFYAHLDRDPELRRKALSFQEVYTEQEDVIEAFLRFAASLGYEFTFREFMEHMYEQARERE
mgnify:FL=1